MKVRMKNIILEFGSAPEGHLPSRCRHLCRQELPNLPGWCPDSVSPFTFVMQPEKNQQQEARRGGWGWGDGGPPIDLSVEYSGSSLSNA